MFVGFENDFFFGYVLIVSDVEEVVNNCVEVLLVMFFDDGFFENYYVIGFFCGGWLVVEFCDVFWFEDLVEVVVFMYDGFFYVCGFFVWFGF